MDGQQQPNPPQTTLTHSQNTADGKPLIQPQSPSHPAHTQQQQQHEQQQQHPDPSHVAAVSDASEHGGPNKPASDNVQTQSIINPTQTTSKRTIEDLEPAPAHTSISDNSSVSSAKRVKLDAESDAPLSKPPTENPNQSSHSKVEANGNGTTQATETNTSAEKPAVASSNKTDTTTDGAIKIKTEIDDSKTDNLTKAAAQKADVTVINDERLTTIPANITPRDLGHVVYTGAKSKYPKSDRPSDLELFLLPSFDSSHLYCTIQVRIPSVFLSFKNNVAVQAQAVWGTDVYTDDSDIVAAIIHSGKYKPYDAPTSLKSKQSSEQAKSSSSQQRPTSLLVTLRILPRLKQYTSSNRFGIASRGWGSSHMGESIMILSVEPYADDVSSLGRKSGSSSWIDTVVMGEGMKSTGLKSNSGGSGSRKGGRKRTRSSGSFGRRNAALGFSNDHERMDQGMSFVFSDDEGGQICYKYSPSLLIEWPQSLKNFMVDHASSSVPDANESSSLRALPTLRSHMYGYTAAELKSMDNWALWRIRTRDFILCIQNDNGESYHIKRDAGANEKYSIFKRKGEKMEACAENSDASNFEFGAGGVKIVSLDQIIKIDRVYWTQAK